MRGLDNEVRGVQGGVGCVRIGDGRARGDARQEQGGREQVREYDAIIDLPHFHAPGRGYMGSYERAAQFAPYKSLVGLEDEIAAEAEAASARAERVIEYGAPDLEFGEDFDII